MPFWEIVLAGDVAIPPAPTRGELHSALSYWKLKGSAVAFGLCYRHQKIFHFHQKTVVIITASVFSSA